MRNERRRWTTWGGRSVAALAVIVVFYGGASYGLTASKGNGGSGTQFASACATEVGYHGGSGNHPKTVTKTVTKTKTPTPRTVTATVTKYSTATGTVTTTATKTETVVTSVPSTTTVTETEEAKTTTVVSTE